MAEKYKQRNQKLLKYIKSNSIIENTIHHSVASGLFYKMMDYYIDKYPHKSFGKIFIEEFCDEIKKNQYTEVDEIILKALYIDCEDIAKENPSDTLKKLENKYGRRL